jgi:uncharacterized protein YqgC (DUF456 family)
MHSQWDDGDLGQWLCNEHRGGNLFGCRMALKGSILGFYSSLSSKVNGLIVFHFLAVPYQSVLFVF